MSETLTGQRVRLRGAKASDIPAIVVAASDPRVSAYTSVPSPYEVKHAESWIAAGSNMQHPEVNWLVETLEGQFVGVFSFEHYNEFQRSVSVGYWAAASSRGKGYMREAAKLAIEHAFSTSNLEKITWQAHVGNDASWKLAWNLGFTFEGVTRHVRESNSRVVNMWSGSLLRGEKLEPTNDKRLPKYFDVEDYSDVDPAKRPYDSRRPQMLVKQFHDVYNLPVLLGETPSADRERIHMRMGLVSEEYQELTTALYGEKAGEIIALAQGEAKTADDHTRDTIEVADALADLVYVIYGMALECGIDLDAVLEEVQASNLSKLGEDGKPIYREDGKVLKGPGFFNPNIARALGLEKEETE
ncbi:MAG: GNAT family N-acetyltransferase [Actinomycetaceae bacterium]|nr:GNAT family N-acetyltransferase [Actinomycetaceae bacterium]